MPFQFTYFDTTPRPMRPTVKRPRKPIDRLRTEINDGGRKAAGFGNTNRDCVTRAIAIATGRPYEQVWQEMKPFACKRGPDHGVYTTRSTFHDYMKAHGFTYTKCLSPQGRAGRVKLRKGDLPSKHRLVVMTKGHAQAVINGVVQDMHATRTPNVRCYWTYTKEVK
jgi:hypothetical protein